MARKSPEKKRPAGRFLATGKARQNAFQATVLVVLALLFWALLHNLMGNLSSEGINIDFSFLLNESGFDVNETLIPYSASSSYMEALFVGVLNTLHLAAVCIVLTTLLGVTIGLLTLSDIKIVRGLCRLYIESMRNLPKLLVILAVYVLLVLELPVVRQAFSFADVAFLSNRGLNLPALKLDYEFMTLTGLAGFVLLCGAGCFALWLAVRGRIANVWLARLLPLGLLGTVVAVAAQVVHIEIPEFGGFNFDGGSIVSVPFLSLAIGLSVYQGAQVAEVVRSGILSVPKGQLEAGRALGLKSGHITWLIVFPQAMRVIIPPLSNQYLNLLKNTSIGVAIGYSDLVSIMNTAINQTFRPVELMMLTMVVYMTIGLAVSIFLNIFNKRAQLRER